MNLDELRPILAQYRQQVETAWSPATAHSDYQGAAGSPAGQCGATSAWLQRRLREDHGIETTYCVGDVFPRRGLALREHCWLQMNHGWDRVVLDLTGDQMPGLEDAPIIFATYRQLIDRDIWYSLFSADNRLADPVQPRLALLTEALS